MGRTNWVADLITMQLDGSYAPSITTGMIQCKFCLLHNVFADQRGSVQQSIRDYHPDYRVTAHSWPSFLYKDETYDPLKPTDGLFKGQFLLKVRFVRMKDHLLRSLVDIQIHLHVSHFCRDGRARAAQPGSTFNAGSSKATKD
jgi:hypothetical protein